MSSLSETSGTITIVMPLDTDAGSMNSMLFPAPVPMITTTGLFCCIMACSAGSCTLRNSACLPTNCFSASLVSTSFIIFHRRYSSWIASLRTAAACVPFLGLLSSVDGICRNECHSVLTSLKLARFCSVLKSPSVIGRPYIIPPIFELCPVCRSNASSSTSDSSLFAWTVVFTASLL
ncbi:hypothetical protein EJ04DRAFT_453019 [Polyplosphaeria fusca]|uniref:Uncharacterized protein n=1 Tax=Polyplosphaeria fusca TaxID=682080 RepID=A0A9P4UTX8_9PLEO|nr:hypothetical protein EJ04DRAFT_453019 [Polyplosphaeria fusca]